MKFFLVLLLAVIGALALPANDKEDRILREWDKFKSTHQRTFRDAAEENLRKRLFTEKLRQVEEHNEKYEQGLVTYTIGINQFSDYTPEEMNRLTHALVKPDVLPKAAKRFEPPVNYAAPASFDWRDKGVINPVKNQAQCGSCWAFSAVGALEPQLAIKHGITVSLSEQNLVDCDTENWGCSGGWMVTAYRYIMKNHGIDTERSYPYEARDANCRYNPTTRGADVVNIVEIEAGKEETMKVAVASAGPLAVAIDVTGDWGYYTGGVFYNATCTQWSPGHAVTVVGYGTENGHDYWLIKNSWGQTWGQEGYIKMARNRNNNCGIANFVSYPIV